MEQIPVDTFLSNVDAIAAEAPSYRLGGDGNDRECDCIGLIIGAIRRSGGTWTGIHGSNYAARNEMACLLPVSNTENLKAGEVVYKAASPEQTNYALPSRYAKDPDQCDYYHAGVVRSVDPLQIIHCTSPGGITIETRLGKWTHRGWLSKVSQEENMLASITATVTADHGSTVNLRKFPDGTLIKRIPVGTVVTVLSCQGDWYQINHNGISGWMKASFLSLDTKDSSDISTRLSALEQRLDLAEQRLAQLDGGLG